MSGYLRGIPGPGEWLKQTIEEHGISLNGLAHKTFLEATQIQRWVSGREKIPRYHLAEIAQIISPQSLDYVLKLKDCEDFAIQLHKQTVKLSKTLGNVNAAQIESSITQKIDELLSQETNLSRNARAEISAKYLTNAHFIVRTWLKVPNEEALVSPINVDRHLQYPNNHFAGLLLNLDPIRQAGLMNLRKIISHNELNNKQGKASITLAYHHATHLLALYGTPTDHRNIEVLLQQKDTLADPLLNYLGLIARAIGLSIAETDPSTLEQFIAMARADKDLLSIFCVFDAIHYSDVVINAQGNIPSLGAAKGFRQAIPQILRHLEHTKQYQNISAIEMLKLIHLLQAIGAKPFMHPNTLKRLDDACSQIRTLDNSLVENDFIRKEFLQQFDVILRKTKK
jgi:transcriptional regulator with XRE-family HTH domain